VVDLPAPYMERIVAQDLMCNENAQTSVDCSYDDEIDTECSDPTRAVAVSCRASCKLSILF